MVSSEYDQCVSAKNLGIDILAYVNLNAIKYSLAETYYSEHGIETAVFTLSHPGMLGALREYPAITVVCGDNLASWNWQEFFEYKNENEFANTETWDFATDAVGSLGTAFTTSGSVTYGDGVSLGTAATYMWFNLPVNSKLNGVAQFEIEWTPATANQRIFHIGAYNDGNGFIAQGKKLGFYAENLWHYLDGPVESSETETHTVKVYWNAFSYIVYVDGKAIGSWIINFNQTANNGGRNFCFGSNSTAFLGKIRNLQMWY